jgi:predicted transcriptional regulator
VLANLVNNGLVKVTRVALESSGNVECVLQTIVDSLDQGLLRTLAELELGAERLLVNILHPVVVGSSITVVDMVLEGNQVRVGDGLGVNR